MTYKDKNIEQIDAGTVRSAANKYDKLPLTLGNIQKNENYHSLFSKTVE